MRTTGLCSARFYISLAYLSKLSNPFRLYAARYRGRGGKQPFYRLFGRIVLSLSFTALYNATSHTKTNADNRTLPFPVNGNPSARFRKRNVTDVGKPTRTRPEARGADNRTLFRSLLLFYLHILANNLSHSDFTLLAIADGVANSRFIGCLVALFFP